MKARRGEAQAWLANLLGSAPFADECIPWPFGRDSKGYGRVRDPIAKRPALVTHRVLDLCGVRRPSHEHMALHSCDNPSCCNPRHLRWGTAAENSADMLARNRSWRPAPKLTAEDVREVRRLRGAMSGVAVAARFGVSPQAICDIHMGRRWKDVT